MNHGDGTPSPTLSSFSANYLKSVRVISVSEDYLNNIMSTTATTNYASEMWNNHAYGYMNTQNVGHSQWPTMPNNYYNNQNNYYSQNCVYTHVLSDGCGKMYQQKQNEGIVKPEPTSSPGYYGNFSGNHTNTKMINRWQPVSYYSQQQQLNYTQQQMNAINLNYVENPEDTKLINSPGECSTSDTSYGSPQSGSGNFQSSTSELEDSPNLRAILSQPTSKPPLPYFEECTKTYAQHESAEKEGNLAQFHGGFESIEGPTSINKDAVGGAAESAPSSQDSTEPCQVVTRVEAGGDNADNKMASTQDVQQFYPWMKTITGSKFQY